MVFYVVGLIFVAIGLINKLFPAKKHQRLHGYHSPAAETSQESFQVAQKLFSNYSLLFGLLMTGIGWGLKSTGNTNYFIVEMLVLVFPIMPIFILTEKKLAKYQEEMRRENNEHSDD